VTGLKTGDYGLFGDTLDARILLCLSTTFWTMKLEARDSKL